MSVRAFSDISNNNNTPSKYRRPQATQLEELRGFEFLEHIAGLSLEEFGKLGDTRITFIYTQLELELIAPSTRTRAESVAYKIIQGTSSTLKLQNKYLCQVLKATCEGINLSAFSNTLFFNQNPLFKKLCDIPNHDNYGKLYLAINREDEAEVSRMLDTSLDLSLPQPESYILFDLACFHLSTALIYKFISKTPFASSNVCSSIVLNKKLSSIEKITLLQHLRNAGLKLDHADSNGITPLSSAITIRDETLFNYLLLETTDDASGYLMKSINAKFTEGVRVFCKFGFANESHLKSAIDSKQYETSAFIAQSIRYKWPNVVKRRVPIEPADLKIEVEGLQMLVASHSDRSKKIGEKPSLYSMETLSAIRKSNINHFLDLTKRVCHAWGIVIECTNPQTLESINGGGNSAYKSLYSWMAFLSKMDDIPEAQFLLKELKQVFNKRTDPEKLDQLEDRVKNNITTICMTGYNTHVTYAIFKRSVSLYANRGRDNIGPGVSIYSVPIPELVDRHTLDKIIFDKDLPLDMYYSESDMIHDLNLQFVYSIKLQKQSGPFCSLDSLKAASLSLLCLDKVAVDKTDLEEEWIKAEEEVRGTYKLLTDEYRIDILYGLLREVDDYLEHDPHTKETSIFYYQLLLAINIKMNQSFRWDKDDKKEYDNLLKCYMNKLVDKT